MIRKKFKLGRNEREIIKAVGLGILILSSFALPNLPMALKPFLKRQGKKRFMENLNRLEDKGIIYLGGEEIKLTKKGLELQKQYEIENIKIKPPKRWDGIWKLVSYDIPEQYKKQRDIFREKIENLGFKKIQKSLWVYPYECKEEISIIAQNLSVAPYIIYMNTDKLPDQQNLEDYFDL